MIRLVLVFIVSVLLTSYISNACYAESSVHLDVSDLSETDKLEIAAQIAKKRQEASTVSGVALKRPQLEYAQTGVAISIAISAICEKLGIDVHDFVNSDLGIITILLLVWQFMGSVLVLYFSAGVMLVVGAATWLYCYRRRCLGLCIIQGEDNNGKRFTRYVYGVNEDNYNTPSDSELFYYWLTLILLLAMVFVLILVAA
ncbi:MAG: hypothetical protein HC836_37675 [Richelia sp. RM2_1_2]|nr:hypothetical protein [Richelia sp. RM2_1_2]